MARQEADRPFMTSYGMISIFSGGADPVRRPVPVLASVLIHGIAAGIISFGIMNTPRIVTPENNGRYMVRNLDFPIPEVLMRRLPGNPMDEDARRSDAGVSAAAERMAAYLHAQHPVAQADAGRQVLLQADLPPRVHLSAEIQVPTFVIWKPSKVRTNTIVAPPPERPHAAEVIPSINVPNEELELRSVAITATNMPTSSTQTPAGTTSPVVVHELGATPKAPATVAQVSDKLAQTAVMSVSDLRVNDRKSVLPPVNETAGFRAQDGSTPGAANSPDKTTTPGDANTHSPQTENHSGAEAGNTRTGQNSIDMPSAQEQQVKGGSDEGRLGSSHGNNAVFNQDNHAATFITLAKDGHFGAVVVGISLQDRFPEMEGLWSGRLIYTVHIHVGLAHSWTLEYSLPRSTEAAAGGSVAHVEAPWPYSIVRPDLAPGSIGADALIVNGFINKDGRFETLNPIIPPAFPQSDFVLHCLQQWQFRPAAQDGHPIRVEVMLIIPDQAG